MINLDSIPDKIFNNIKNYKKVEPYIVLSSRFKIFGITSISDSIKKETSIKQVINLLTKKFYSNLVFMDLLLSTDGTIVESNKYLDKYGKNVLGLILMCIREVELQNIRQDSKRDIDGADIENVSHIDKWGMYKKKDGVPVDILKKIDTYLNLDKEYEDDDDDDEQYEEGSVEEEIRIMDNHMENIMDDFTDNKYISARDLLIIQEKIVMIDKLLNDYNGIQQGFVKSKHSKTNFFIKETFQQDLEKLRELYSELEEWEDYVEDLEDYYENVIEQIKEKYKYDPLDIDQLTRSIKMDLTGEVSDPIINIDEYDTILTTLLETDKTLYWFIEDYLKKQFNHSYRIVTGDGEMENYKSYKIALHDLYPKKQPKYTIDTKKYKHVFDEYKKLKNEEEKNTRQLDKEFLENMTHGIKSRSPISSMKGTLVPTLNKIFKKLKGNQLVKIESLDGIELFINTSEELLEYEDPIRKLFIYDINKNGNVTIYVLIDDVLF